jgi:hypothetical protein
MEHVEVRYRVDDVCAYEAPMAPGGKITSVTLLPMEGEDCPAGSIVLDLETPEQIAKFPLDGKFAIRFIPAK